MELHRNIHLVIYVFSSICTLQRYIRNHKQTFQTLIIVLNKSYAFQGASNVKGGHSHHNMEGTSCVVASFAMGIDKDRDTSLDASAQVTSAQVTSDQVTSAQVTSDQVTSAQVEDSKTSVVAIDKTSDGFHSFYYSLGLTGAF